MKTTKTILCTSIIIVLVLFSSIGKSQDNPNSAEIKIKTSAVCGMCKETIESNLVFEKGIKKSSLDVKVGILTVIYNPKKTTPEKIRLSVSKLGYDADEIPADEKAYNKLSSCCKKDNAPH